MAILTIIVGLYCTWMKLKGSVTKVIEIWFTIRIQNEFWAVLKYFNIFIYNSKKSNVPLYGGIIDITE